ncbi:MAG: hypothetical protein N3B12_07190 [Armatimonadetes bacterium]|nr:hypothetical protein [Armatimonadota bacterium]
MLDRLIGALYTCVRQMLPDMAEPETITTCARHPRVTTNLRCATCGTPICPQCLVQTPVGAKCRSCASSVGGSLFRPTPKQFVMSCAAGLVSGAIAGLAVEFNLGFFSLLLGLVYGGFVGEIILRASGRKRGVKMESIAAVTMIIGAVAARLLAALSITSMSDARVPFGVLNVLIDLVWPSPIPLITLLLSVAAAVSRIRYI